MKNLLPSLLEYDEQDPVLQRRGQVVARVRHIRLRRRTLAQRAAKAIHDSQQIGLLTHSQLDDAIGECATRGSVAAEGCRKGRLAGTADSNQCGNTSLTADRVVGYCIGEQVVLQPLDRLQAR
jgi:hypothetical protein